MNSPFYLFTYHAVLGVYQNAEAATEAGVELLRRSTVVDVFFIDSLDDILEQLNEREMRILRTKMREFVGNTTPVEQVGKKEQAIALFDDLATFVENKHHIAMKATIMSEAAGNTAETGTVTPASSKPTKAPKVKAEKAPKAAKAPKAKAEKVAKAPKEKKPRGPNAKDYIRSQFVDIGGIVDHDTLFKHDKFTPSALSTAISDLKNEKYAGPGGTMKVTKSKRSDGVVIYTRTE